MEQYIFKLLYKSERNVRETRQRKTKQQEKSRYRYRVHAIYFFEK